MKSRGYMIVEVSSLDCCIFKTSLKSKSLQKWSHEFEYERKNDERVKKFFKRSDLIFHKSINPRDELYGGRCSLFKLFAEIKDDEKIQYLDVVRC